MDSDSDELPDTLCLVWIQQAFNRIMQELLSAGKLRAIQTKTSTASVSTLSLTTPVSDIQQIAGPTFVLEPISFERALEMFPLNDDSAAPVTTGTPAYWSRPPTVSPDETTSKVWLWPAPAAAESYSISYVAQADDAGAYTTSSTPGVPKEFHAIMGEYLCSRAYELQQNAQMAVVKMNRFEAELDLLARRYRRETKANLVTLGGDRARRQTTDPTRLRFNWE